MMNGSSCSGRVRRTQGNDGQANTSLPNAVRQVPLTTECSKCRVWGNVPALRHLSRGGPNWKARCTTFSQGNSMRVRTCLVILFFAVGLAACGKSGVQAAHESDLTPQTILSLDDQKFL